MTEWHPQAHIDPHSAAADDLDAHVRGIDWTTPGATDWGSPERFRVAGWVASTDLVDREVHRRIPRQPDRAARMFEWCEPRVTEKITGVEMASLSRQWNRRNLWDPTMETSLCGWVRRTVESLVLRNARRVLTGGPVNTGALERDDGTNPLLDRLVAAERRASVFADHPRMRIIRPDRAQAARWRRLLDQAGDPERTGEATREIAREARSLGLASDCDDVDDATVCALLLTPLPASRTDLLSRLDYGMDLGDAPALLALSERRALTDGERRRLLTAVEHAARTAGVGEADVLRRMSMAVARLACA